MNFSTIVLFLSPLYYYTNLCLKKKIFYTLIITDIAQIKLIFLSQEKKRLFSYQTYNGTMISILKYVNLFKCNQSVKSYKIIKKLIS